MYHFTQCNKDEPISEIIAQEEEGYENLEKVETVWKDGDEKIETLWKDGCEKELSDELTALNEISPKMRILGVEIENVAVGVIRLGANCGDYPTLEVFMDCEDSKNASYIKKWDISKDKTVSGDVSWLTTYGIQLSSSGNLTYYFCLVPHYLNSFPNFQIDVNQPWGMLAVTNEAMLLNGGIESHLLMRFYDNEDSNNANHTYTYWKDAKNNMKTALYSLVAGVEQGNNTKLSFLERKVYPYPWDGSWGSESRYNKTYFPNFGFKYAVFSKRPVVSGYPVAEVLSDDEDSNNINSWTYLNTGSPNCGYNMRRSLDFGFIYGSGNTNLFVTPAKL